jgi:hypothetical protein
VSEVEFLVPGADPEPPAEEISVAGRRPLRDHVPTTLASGLWTVAAAVGLLAPFTSVYRETQPGGGVRFDGWGRISALNADGPVGHAPRYGLPLALAGTACMVLAVVVAVYAWRGRRTSGSATRLLAALGIAAGGVMIGVAAAAWLFVQAVHDSITAALTGSVAADAPVGAAAFPGVSAGPFVLLVALGGIAAISGSIASWPPAAPATYAQPAVGDRPADPPASDPVAPTDPAATIVAVPPSAAMPPTVAMPPAEPVTISVVASAEPAPPTPTDGEELLGG